MKQTKLVAGACETLATDIIFTSRVDNGESSIVLNSAGMGPLTGTGTIEISANGCILSQAGKASVQLSTNVKEESQVHIDGGLLGTVTIANGAPTGNSQTIKMDSLGCSIGISNGDIPGASQSIQMDGATQSIQLSAGDLPYSPTIKMEPTGITMSFGPANSINIGPEGVSIQGLLVEIKGEIEATVGGPLVTVKSDAMTQIGGAIVMIQ